MMKSERYHQLGSDGFSYCRAQFKKLGEIASALGSLPLEKGRIEAWLPEYLEPDRVHCFSTGGLNLKYEQGDYVEIFSDSEFEDAETIEQLEFGAYRIACEFLRENPNNAFLMKCELSESKLSELQNPYFLVSPKGGNLQTKDIYLYITGKLFQNQTSINNAFDLLDEIFDHSSSHPGIGLLCHDFEATDRLTRENLSLLVKNASHLFIEAYDGENWLIWSHHRSATHPMAS